MRSSVRRLVRPLAVATAAISFAMIIAPTTALSQTGTISGMVTDTANHPLPASIYIVGKSQAAYATSDGAYTINDVPAGTHRVVAHYLGFKTDTSTVTVVAGQVAIHRIRLRESANTLNTVVVISPRFNETKEAALEQQKNADNIINVMSGDEIRSLPNANAAEALARMPGVTAERDEGEGKYVEIRGTPPNFQNVMIDGANVPGTLATDQRAVKLDDVPADLLGSIEVMKTLTADQPAKAIGGTVNLVTKVPEGSPRGYAFANLGYQTLQGSAQGQANLSYGGRVGTDEKFGFLFSGSYDRTNRIISDVEPSWTADAPYGNAGGYYAVPNGSAFTHVYPSSFSQRPYDYFRTRYGLGGDLDYRASATSSFFLKGLWSAFFDEANRWETGFGAGTDSTIGGVPTATGGSVGYTVSNRGPIEHTWGFTGGGKHELNNVLLTWQANWAGSIAQEHNHYDDNYAGPSGFNYTYDANKLIPKYFVDASTASSIAAASSYPFQAPGNGGAIATDNEFNSGQIVGAHIDALIRETIGTKPAGTKLGLFIDNEHKGYVANTPFYEYVGAAPVGVANFPSSYSQKNFYGDICPSCYILAPYASIQGANNYLVANQSQFQYMTNGNSDSLGTFAGTEQVVAAYVMQTFDISELHVNLGLRFEHTDVGYVGRVQLDSTSDSLSLKHGQSHYSNFFPSMQLRYATDENTNLRFAVTYGIARPNYNQLPPSFSSFGALRNQITQGLSEGNPNLKPEYAWNYDLLAEHYFQSVGILSGGLFYKQINQFIFDRTFEYTGPVEQFKPVGSQFYYVTQPQNGPNAWLYGFEIDYTQHLNFLPGAWKGLGFDVNWTYVQSQAKIPIPAYDSVSYQNLATGQTVFPYLNMPYRYAPIQRQFPNIYNAALLYDYTPVSARLAAQYTGASIYGYGVDGTSNPASGDNYNYAHFQLDFGLTWNVTRDGALSIQALNMTNSVFGFFNGTTRNAYNTQREYYGATVSVGFRQGFSL